MANKPIIDRVHPEAAIPGGEFQIRGSQLSGADRPRVTIGDTTAPILVGSSSFVVARVPEGTMFGPMFVENDTDRSLPWTCEVGVQVADQLHPVANPAVDPHGGVFTTFSGSRGQKTPVSVYKVDPSFQAKPFLSELMNATGLAFDREGLLYVSSRYDGVVYQVTPKGEMSVYVEGMGVATGIAFDAEENLYVGDRSGTIFKISRSRQIYVFATLEQSIAAYHLTFGPDGFLYVTGPTTSSFDSIFRISPAGEVQVFYRGLGRPQGMAFDIHDRLYVAASLGGQRGVVRFNRDAEPELFLSGPNIVGLAFAAPTYLYITTTSALFRINAGVKGRPLPNLA
ncbi:MAG: IPT/TIG domain-containing protein [Bryobacteraceae bacterium]